MSEQIQKEIASVYEELKGVLDIIRDRNGWFDDEGYSNHVNEILDRLKVYCPEINNVDSYKITSRPVPSRGNIIDVTLSKTKLNSIIGRIKGLNNFGDTPSPLNGHTFIQSQTQSQSLSVVLELQERIISEIQKHDEGSNERSFLEKVKSKLSEVKSVTDILSIALKIGSDFGLDPDTIRKLLGL